MAWARVIGDGAHGGKVALSTDLRYARLDHLRAARPDATVAAWPC